MENEVGSLECADIERSCWRMKRYKSNFYSNDSPNDDLESRIKKMLGDAPTWYEPAHLTGRSTRIGISFVKSTKSICHGYTHIYTQGCVGKLVSWSTIFMI
jgi:hypothetical protein